jgi:CRP/FNR family cyclic AMP-dependent transcriptional regulator
MGIDDVLGKVPLFSKLSRRDMSQLVKSGRQMNYPAGKELTSTDEKGVCFFVIEEGEARVTVNGEEVNHLGPGDYFGEMALIDRSFRMATVTSLTDMKCFVMTQWEFRPFATEHPEVSWALLEAMVQRVRDTESRKSATEG